MIRIAGKRQNKRHKFQGKLKKVPEGKFQRILAVSWETCYTTGRKDVSTLRRRDKAEREGRSMVTENYRAVEARVAAACARSGRKREDVTLIAVSKTKPVELIRELTRIGVRDFGENKAQELKEKSEQIPESLRWHFIGNLQTNKVKYVVGRACLVHSVSSLRLAEALQKEAEKKGLVCPVLVEVNIAQEATKHGIQEEDAVQLVRQAGEMPNLEVRGLMAIAPPVEDPEENRPYFREMRRLAGVIEGLGLPRVRMTELSMGMTGDFEVAIEEGATMVRVGTAIFGSRNRPEA